jgi:uncharacterized protein
MLFKRRKQLSPVKRLRNAIWPARSFERSFRYTILRLGRIHATPHSIALGCAAGVFAIFTPFLGCQMMLAAFLAIVLRGNVFASAVGTCAGNPLTYPVIWGSTFALGNLFLGGAANAEISTLSTGAEALGRSIGAASPDGVASAVQGLWPLLKPMALGSLPLGGLTAALTYVMVRRLLQSEKRSTRPQGSAAAAAR